MSPFAVLANMSVNGPLLGYTPWMQFRDLAPSAALAAVMSGIVLAARAALRPWLAGFSGPSVAYATELAIVVPIGIAIYLASSLVIRPKPLFETCSLLLPIMQKRFPPIARTIKRILNRNDKNR